MEPVTHILTGACLGRSGFNRKTAYATLAMAIAAEAPDLDMVSEFRGPVCELQHHRGITHSLAGAPFMVVGTLLFIFLLSRVWRRPTRIPIRWGWLCSGVLIADLSHILLDYTTSYGVRPFLPFNGHWYAWSIVSIWDPFLFAALLGALLVPAILGLTDREIGARSRVPRGRGFAVTALIFMGLWWSLRNAEHAHAEALLRNGSYFSDPIRRVAAEPQVLSPFNWRVLLDLGDRYRTANVGTLHDQVSLSPLPIYKPPVTPAIAAAERTYLGRVYLDWSKWPLVENMGDIPVPGAPPPPAGQHWHAVEFRDLRYEQPLLAPGVPTGPGEAGTADDVQNPPLSGWVYIGPGDTPEGMYMQGVEQH
jgi:inner membrane protein